jgi:hypothetical protein
MYLYICQQIEFKMNKYRITYRFTACHSKLSTLSLCIAKKSSTTEIVLKENKEFKD